MKSILFVVPAFTVGGTNTSLISLLPFIDREKFTVYVYALSPTGPMGFEIAKHAKVINPLSHKDTDFSTNNKTGIIKFFSAIKKGLGIFGFDATSVLYRYKIRKLLSIKFDCVVAFQEGEATRFVQYFSNVRKVAWIRSSYSRYLLVTRTPREDRLYDKFDVIVNVSKTAMDGFLKVMPQCLNKSVYVYNLVNKERIISLSHEEIDFPQGEDVFTIISLGRVDKVKHFGEIPGIAMQLKKRAIPFRWLIIGGPTVRYPEEYESLAKSIEDFGLRDFVKMLGHQSNPYPYLVKSNLLVCLSESETFNHTFAEARTLGVPVLSVDYSGAEEFLLSGQGGVITSRNSIADELCTIIQDKNYYSSLKSQAEQFSYDNGAQLKVLYDHVFN